VVLLNTLGGLLESQGGSRLGDAIGYYRTARSHRPRLGALLCHALANAGRLEEVEELVREMIRRHPDHPALNLYLGIVEFQRRNHGAAEAAFRKAVELDPGYAEAHNNLGCALSARGEHAAAEAACRAAIGLRPGYAVAYVNLGIALQEQRKYAAAGDAFRKAAELKPEYSEAHNNLGNVLVRQGKFAAAEAAYRRAIELKPPEPARVYVNLSRALVGQQRPGAAEAAFRKAVTLRPEFGLARYHLGVALMQQARFAAAADSFDKAGDTLPAKHPRREQARQLLQKCQRYAALDARLPTVLRGDEKPADAAEQLEFARLCVVKKQYAAAARFSRDAFDADPKLAEDSSGARYDAACAAALAGSGRGEGADKLDVQERARWRRQALDWLRQELARWDKALGNGNAQAKTQVRQTMRHWQSDGDLAGVRAGDALARLPDEEREQWEKLWSDVDALLQRASQPE
jgi:Flp pilus assembly protein TadD